MHILIILLVYAVCKNPWKVLNILDDILSNRKSTAMHAKSGLKTQYLLFQKRRISIFRIVEQYE